MNIHRPGDVFGGPIRTPRVRELAPRPPCRDAFTLITNKEATPRQWMLACFEHGIDRSSRDLIFMRLLRMNIGADGTADSIAGWPIVDEDEHFVTTQATGPAVEVSLSLVSLPNSIRLTTSVRYLTLRGWLTWALLSPIHRRQAAVVLRTGAQLVGAGL